MEEKILQSEIIQQKIGLAPVTDLDTEDQDTSKTIIRSHTAKVPQRIWIKKQQENVRKLTKMGT